MRILFKPVLSFLICLALTACAVIAGENEPNEGLTDRGSQATFPYDRFVEGKPSFDLRARGGIYIWRIGNSWSVRMARRMDRPRTLTPLGPIISGTVTVEKANAVDMRKFNMSQVSTAVLRRNSIQFRIEQRDDIGNEIEGFDFRIRPVGPEHCITFDIKTDGVPRADEVYLGNFMHRPDSLPLTICLHSSFN